MLKSGLKEMEEAHKTSDIAGKVLGGLTAVLGEAFLLQAVVS